MNITVVYCTVHNGCSNFLFGLLLIPKSKNITGVIEERRINVPNINKWFPFENVYRTEHFIQIQWFIRICILPVGTVLEYCSQHKPRPGAISENFGFILCLDSVYIVVNWNPWALYCCLLVSTLPVSWTNNVTSRNGFYSTYSRERSILWTFAMETVR